MKKLFFTLMLLIILPSFGFTSYADTSAYYNDYAVKLSEIGVFKGTGNGFELNREPTRLEGLIMLIRLLGKEDEAESFKDKSSVFTDVPSWGRGYVNYAYENGLTKGIGNDLFGTNDKMNGQSFVTLLLRSLGYDDISTNNDFTWAESIDFAKSVGLLEEELYFKMVSGTFTRDYVAKSSYNALLQPEKDGSGILIDKLVKSGDLSSAQAISLKELPTTTDTTQNITGELSSIEIGKLADAVVMIEAKGYDDSSWTGSGFYISSDGQIITNYHVVEGAKTLTIKENDGTVYSDVIGIVSYSELWDLAVLNVNKSPKLFLKTGDSNDVAVGQEVYAIGSPMGLQNTVSTGIVSSIREGIFQISAPISHGSSGGVLLNTKGEAIGVTYAGIEEGENLGFAIPINQYTNLNKNLKLTLETFNNTINKVDRPAEIEIIQTASDEVEITWSEVTNAEYYRVYMSESLSGPYEILADSYDNDLWTLGGVTTSGLERGITYYVKVTSVRGNYESLPSDTKSITLKGITTTATYDEYANYLMYQYGSMSFNGYTTYFSDAVVEEAEDSTLMLIMYIEDSYELLDFLDMMYFNTSGIEINLKEIAYEAANYYDRNTSVFIIYNDVYDTYPSEFKTNALYDETVTYIDSSDQWHVFYPFVNVYYDHDYDYFDTGWDY